MDTTPLDNFRLFAEEADLLQGVQMSSDVSTGFAAIANEMMGGYKEKNSRGRGRTSIRVYGFVLSKDGFAGSASVGENHVSSGA